MSSYYTAEFCPDCGGPLLADDRGRAGYFIACRDCSFELPEDEAVQQGYDVAPEGEDDDDLIKLFNKIPNDSVNRRLLKKNLKGFQERVKLIGSMLRAGKISLVEEELFFLANASGVVGERIRRELKRYDEENS